MSNKGQVSRIYIFKKQQQGPTLEQPKNPQFK